MSEKSQAQFTVTNLLDDELMLSPWAYEELRQRLTQKGREYLIMNPGEDSEHIWPVLLATRIVSEPDARKEGVFRVSNVTDVPLLQRIARENYYMYMRTQRRVERERRRKNELEAALAHAETEVRLKDAELLVLRDAVHRLEQRLAQGDHRGNAHVSASSGA
jgi:hypothetical protein